MIGPDILGENALEQHYKLASTVHRMLIAMAATARSLGASMLAGVALTGQALED